MHRKTTKTDECELQWHVAKVEADGKEIKLNGWQMQSVIEELFIEMAKNRKV